ncbi:hypothetical protein BGZ99_002723 [Dissophora globulifera]|uniref:Uncharacterized protein n=1 Tax=Dissophora globulifera TaxID=979702 RepID=A0A9P6QZK5_9FUNG|nr:hypothetical protein BGZ99_002723 [Dissophora globulifera]
MDGFDNDGFGFSGDEDDHNSADELYNGDDEDAPYRTVIKMDNTALPGLFRCCPALEILFWRPRKEMDMNKISRLLREYCPRLDTIRRTDNDDDLSSEPERDVRRQGLKYFDMGIWFLDTASTSALLTHASSLQDIKLDLRGNEKVNIENAARLLQLCSRLKRFSIRANGIDWRPQDGLLLFQHKWGCEQLERLRLFGIADPWLRGFSADDQEVQGQAQPEEQGQGHDLEQSQEQTEAIEHNQSLVSSKTTSATAAGSSKYNPFMPTHWQTIWKPSFDEMWKLESTSGIVFRRALFERADSMPNLRDLDLNGTHYRRYKSS